MSIFVVKVKSYSPYPIEKEYVEKSATFGVAINRAVKKYRAEPFLKGKHVDALIINVGRGSGTLKM